MAPGPAPASPDAPIQSRGRLAAEIAHDLNHLLTVVLHAADAIAASTADLAAQAASPRVHAILADADAIRSAAERGSQLIGRLGPDAPTPLPARIDAHAALDAFARLARPLLGQRFTLDLSFQAPGCAVVIAPGDLDRVLLNLVVNARDAQPDGGRIALRVRRAAPPDVASRRGGRGVLVFEVEDDGPGIAPDLVPRVFQRGVTTRAARGGSGLGLATVRAIAERQGGSVTIESPVGHGTRVLVRLPCVPAARRAAAPPPAAASCHRGTLLLVDDETPLRRLVARRLASIGWEVVDAGSAEEALALLARAFPPRLTAIVTDLILPGRSGAALIAEARALLASASLPAIIASGHPEARDAAGDEVALMAKPYRMSELEQLLDRLAPPPIAYSRDQARL